MPTTNNEGEQPKAKTLKELASVFRELAIKRLADVLQKGQSDDPEDKPASDMAVIAASTAILDRADGKPTQYVEQTTKIVTLGDLLSEIGEREKAFQNVITVTPVEVPAIPHVVTWDDVL